MYLGKGLKLHANFGTSKVKFRATDFLRLWNCGRKNEIRHLKRNPYSVKITVT